MVVVMVLVVVVVLLLLRLVVVAVVMLVVVAVVVVAGVVCWWWLGVHYDLLSRVGSANLLPGTPDRGVGSGTSRHRHRRQFGGQQRTVLWDPLGGIGVMGNGAGKEMAGLETITNRSAGVGSAIRSCGLVLGDGCAQDRERHWMRERTGLQPLHPSQPPVPEGATPGTCPG